VSAMRDKILETAVYTCDNIGCRVATYSASGPPARCPSCATPGARLNALIDKPRPS